MSFVVNPTNLQSDDPQKTKNNNRSKVILGSLAALLVVSALGTAGFFWNQARQAKDQSVLGVQNKNKEESAKIIDELKGIIESEAGVEPTVARVEDAEVLKKTNEEFYKNAQTNDYLVLYPDRAIIYRSEEKKIINIAPIVNNEKLKKDAEALKKSNQQSSGNTTQDQTGQTQQP